jgi:hypothetical protein
LDTRNSSRLEHIDRRVRPGAQGPGRQNDLHRRGNDELHPNGKPPQPHSTGGASKELGEDGAVVLIRAMSPPKSDDVWDPPAGAELERRDPSRWHEDFANPGWLSRERQLCVGSACVRVLEWHAPEASEDDIERMSLIASSIRMATPNSPRVQIGTSDSRVKARVPRQYRERVLKNAKCRQPLKVEMPDHRANRHDSSGDD